jgi:hypothetical protein
VPTKLKKAVARHPTLEIDNFKTSSTYIKWKFSKLEFLISQFVGKSVEAFEKSIPAIIN